MELACPTCAAINRVPDSRLADNPNCGKCHSPLLPGKPVDLNSASFDAFISAFRPAGRSGFLGVMVWSVQNDGAGFCPDRQ